MFALLMAFTGIILTLSVEFFYLCDAFGLRMNTVFSSIPGLGADVLRRRAVWWVTRSALQGLSQRFTGRHFTAAALLAAEAGLPGHGRLQPDRGPARPI